MQQHPQNKQHKPYTPPGLAPSAVSAGLGNTMPSQAKDIPVLNPQGQALQSEGAQTSKDQQPRCEIADGMHFVGNAQLIGMCTVAGFIQGNLKQAPSTKIAVVVTETGHVKGDIVADQISVMGRTEGTLEASGGSVTLHDSAVVSGHVRYSRLQVNGADLNATLERSPAVASGKAPAPASGAPHTPSTSPTPSAGGQTPAATHAAQTEKLP